MAHCGVFFSPVVEFFVVTLSAMGDMTLFRQYTETNVGVTTRVKTQNTASIKRVIINRALFLNMV